MSTRRDFLKGMGLATAGLTLNPVNNVFAMTSQQTKRAKTEKVKIAYKKWLWLTKRSSKL